ncbi:uncharacterized protein M421DRAFT_237112 [Didymella exigua CBS 183.55]|uniref:Adhesin domain-containing protein n=1 Tax=Didymella exigua CBS 183.55 TaxID=1150837 RepID=A0A6A5RCS2_9PLEO|nr:uncharacterized protein M421DRAFT_237112 [Didymella exigua CBS 183.55]KAF1925492.1 hypothetical protein M421DRAFT_237112 [Didymella exigua CBS 183.55]
MFIDTAAANSRSRQPQAVFLTGYATQDREPQTPLLDESLDSRDAPPTYLEATTPGLYHGRPSGEEGANLLNGEEQEYKQNEYRRRSFRQTLRTKWTKWLGICMLVVFVLAAGVAFTISPRKDRQASVVPVTQASAHAVATGASMTPTSTQPAWPNESEGVIAPDFTAIPWPSQSAAATTPSSSPQLEQIFPIRWPARCGKKYNLKTEKYDFGSSKEVKIKETMHQLDGPYKRIQGWVHITKAPAGQADGTIHARMSYAVSPAIDVDSIKYTSTSNSLIVGGSSKTPSTESIPAGSACLGMSIVLYMAPGTTLDNLNIEATHLGMQIHGGVNFSVTDTTTISLTSGTLDASMLNSRQTYLKTTSGSISGKYALSDLLAIDTKTGSVNIDIAPKGVAAGVSTPAVFKASSQSGSLRVDFESKYIPERDYQTFINTIVGSVDGTFIHGSRTELSTVAGSMTADILPYRSGAFTSTLDTSTHSGRMNVTLRAPYRAKGMPLTGLVSTHKSVSGGVGLKYPKEWQGHVEGTSLSGELHLQGKELELLRKNDEPGKNHVEAKKGTGGSKMVFDTVSGGCDIKIGKI